MKKFKKVLALACIMALAITALAGCGGGKKDAAKDKDVLIAGTEPTFAPFDTTDEDGKLVGFDMDLMDAIAKNQGFKVDYKSFEFDSLIPALEAGNIDMITAGMNSEDPERRKKVDFSDPYYKSGLVVMVKKDNDTVKSIDDLTPDMTVASQIGTTGADLATKLKDEGKIKDTKIDNQFTECLLQLQNGDVNAVIIDKPVAEKALSKYTDLKIVGDTLNAEAFGFAVAKGNTELLDKINKGLENVKKDGTYEKIYEKWFGSPAENQEG